jgi:hypothetical protein
LAASAVAAFAAAKTVDAEGMLIFPALVTFLPRNPPNERVFDLKVDNFSGHIEDDLKFIENCIATLNQERTSHG